jgi:hypothetical protein
MMAASGARMADLGHSTFDLLLPKKYDRNEYGSDRDGFCKILESLQPEICPSESGRAFVTGWREHYKQDKAYSIPGVYYTGCMAVSACFKGTEKIGNMFYFHPKLLIKAYEKIGLKVSETQLYSNIFYSMVLGKVAECAKDLLIKKDEDTIKKIKKEIGNQIANSEKSLSLCTDMSQDSVLTGKIMNPQKINLEFDKSKFAALGSICSKFCHLEKVGQVDGFDKIRFVVDQQEPLNTVIKDKILPNLLTLLKTK